MTNGRKSKEFISDPYAFSFQSQVNLDKDFSLKRMERDLILS